MPQKVSWTISSGRGGVSRSTGRGHVGSFKIDIHYELSDGETYDIRLGAVTLDETNAVNLWRQRPQPSFDV